MPSDRPPRSRKRRIGMWLAKVFGWFISMAFIGVLLIALVAFIAFQNRERIVNSALANLAEDYRVQLETIDFPESGVIEITGLFLTPKDSPEDARPTRIEKLKVTYDFTELRESRKVRSITMVEPTIRVDDRTLKAFGIGEKKTDDKEDTAAVNLDFLGKFADSFTVENGRFELNISNALPMTFDWEFGTSALDMASQEWMTEEPMKLRFSNIKIGPKATFGTIDEIGIDLLLSPDFQRVSVEEFGIVSPKVVVTPMWLPQEKSDPTSQQGTSNDSIGSDREGKTIEQGMIAESTLSTREVSADSWLRVKRVFLRDGKCTVRDFPQVPDMSFGTRFDWSDFRWGDGMFYAGDLLELKLADVAVGDGLATVEMIELRAEWIDLLELNWVESIVVKKPRILLSDGTAGAFLKDASESRDKVEPTDSSSLTEGKPFVVRRFEVWDGNVMMEDFGEGLPRISTGLNANLSNLSVGAGDFSASGQQRIWLDAFEMWSPGGLADLDSEPVAAFATAWAEFDLTELLDEKKIQTLAVIKPILEVTDVSLGQWGTLDGGTAGSPPPTVSPNIWTVADLKITEGRMNVDTQLAGGKVPKVMADFSVMSVDGISKDVGVDPGYRARFSQVRVRNHARAAEVPKQAGNDKPERLGGLFPNDPDPAESEPIRIAGIAERDVVFVKDFTVDATAAGLQREQRIERVTVSGSTVKIGEGLKSMADSEDDGAVDGEPQAAAATLDKGWEIGVLQVTESRLLFESLIPQIEGLEFALETTVTNVLLTDDGLLANEKLQKIELRGIEIMDPYDGFIRVAELPTVFVEFSLSGLMQQRIDKVDLIGPNLYVGQGLFWWIDYQKNYRAQNEGASVGLEDAAVEVNSGGETAEESWEIGTIAAHNGKIVIAPVGYEVGIAPFPFEAETNLEKGEIALKLKIPDEQYVYEFPQYKVQLFGLSGEIDFNIPIKQVDNNLVQTFYLDRAVWKQFEAEDVYLSVTYDADGIYGRFGGNAYEGYAEGQFNIYLTETGKWDAWIAGTKMDTGPLTQTIAPEQFFMEGKVTAKIVSQGVGLEFGETTGDFQILEPGRFNVTKIDEVLKDLPQEWSMLQQSLTKLGLDTLKVFDFESGGGELYFLNRDGWLKLNLDGETGTRELNVKVHDWRGVGKVVGE